MERLSNEKVSRMLLIACFAAYAVTTLVKMCVPTVISAMVSESFLTKSQSGLLSGIFYLTYGVGQLIFDEFFNNHKPFVGIKLALLGSAFCCLLMSLTDNFYLLLLIWSFCALFNACFFPALMKIVSFILCGKHSIWANRYLMIAVQSGTVLCLLSGSIIIKYIGWVKLYYFSALVCIKCFIYWYIAELNTRRCFSQNVSKVKTDKNANQALKKPIMDYIGTGIFCIFAVSFFNSLLNGVKNWAPTIIMETYDTSPSFSVLLNAVIIVTNILFLMLIGKFAPHNKIKSLAIFFGITLPMIILMNFTSLYNEYVYVLLLGMFTSVTTYATNVTAIQVPFYFDKFNDVSRISGIANMCASFGLLVGNYAYGALADMFGWQIIMILCTVFVVINSILSVVAIPKFKRFTKI